MSLALISSPLAAQSPIETACRIADNVLRDAKFHYNLKVADEADNAPLLTVDFDRNFPRPGTAYALTTVTSDTDREAGLEILNYGDCRLILNGKEIWSAKGKGPDALVPIEREYILKGDNVILPLKKGINTIIIESLSSSEGAWKVLMRPDGFSFSLSGLKEIEKSVSDISDWLIIGTFPAGYFDSGSIIEKEFVTGKIYQGADGKPVSWTIPRLELAAANAEIHQPWGEGYTAFNYHAGGLAMAMERLGHYTGMEKYSDYCRTYCDFYLEKREYMKYQKYVLNTYDAWDHKLVDGNLLDYTSAPLLAYAEILLDSEPENRRQEYLDLFHKMEEYLDNKQTRTEDGVFDRINPRKYTVWVDDMYMALPFYVRAAELAGNSDERAGRLDMAAKMVFLFNDYLFHDDIGLYQHAQFTDRKVSMPIWARGNGWALWAVTDILSELPESHPLYGKLLGHYKKHVSGICRLQDPCGLWHNVMTDEDSYPETSSTAIFSLCIARGIYNGWIDAERYAPVVRNGWKGILTMVDEDYMVHGITVGTNCTEDISYYLERPTALNDCHGLFPVICAAIELDKMEKHLNR